MTKSDKSFEHQPVYVVRFELLKLWNPDRHHKESVSVFEWLEYLLIVAIPWSILRLTILIVAYSAEG